MIDAALRDELLALREEDQRARAAWQAGEDGADERLLAVDERTTARMKEIVAAHGWPGRSLVGDDGASAAWLLVQHADQDRAFQRACLDKMAEAVARGEASATDHAYLVDRVAVGEGRRQVYGTQFDEQLEPRPIEDEAHVDERRSAVGLSALAEYRRHMHERYGPR